jgi:cytochrome c oxidase cbb3-type subunit 3
MPRIDTNNAHRESGLKNKILAAGGMAALAAVGIIAAAQAQAPDTAAARAARPPNFPVRTVDPAAAERGKALFVGNSCSFCHGADARGGDGGPSLMRSTVVLSDQKGEKISAIVKHGVPGTAMPAFQLSDAQIADIAEFLHSFRLGNGTASTQRPKSIVVGAADAGKAYFQTNCATCHSVTGDLAGVASKYPDPVTLQQGWLGPKATKPTVATVALADGSRVSGRLTKIDEFSVTVTTPDGERVIPRDGEKPKVEISNPLARHVAMLGRYTDKDIHDVTAYLVTLK